jgi:hypothetical protein
VEIVFRRIALLATAASLFLVAWGTKLWTVNAFGSDIPNWDQWDAEAATLYLPYLTGTLRLENLFHAHNEHRIVFTQILNLLLLKLNGQWDARLQCVVNAALHAGLAAAVWIVIRREFRPLSSAALLAACVALFAVPYSMQNVLGGFHSQQYLLLWTSLLAIYLLLARREYTWTWWLGGFAAVSANFTMASGLLAGAALLAITLLRLVSREISTRNGAAISAVALGALVIGLLTRAPAENHLFLRARSMKEFVLTCAYALEWPFQSGGKLALFCYLPALLFFAWYTKQIVQRRTGRTDRCVSNLDHVVAATFVWLTLQILATGYARGADTPTPASRYLDTLCIGLLINVVAIARLLQYYRGVAQRAIGGLSVVWCTLIAWGLWKDASSSLTTLYPAVGSQLAERERNLQAYIATGRRSHLDGKEIPYPRVDVLMDRLSYREIRDILPVSVRAPLPLQAGLASQGFSSAGIPPGLALPLGTSVIGSYTSGLGEAQLGEWSGSRIDSPYGYLRLGVAGTPNDPGLRIELTQQVAGANELANKLQSERWTYVELPLTHGALQFRIVDNSEAGWVAFTAPREMAWLSYRAMQLSASGRQITLAGAALLTLSTIAWLSVTLLSKQPARPQN